MADIWYSTGNGNVVDRGIGIFELFFRICDAGIDQVVLQSDADIMFKFPGKIVFTDMLLFRQKRQGKFLLKMNINIFHTSTDIIGEHGVIVQTGGMEQQKFRQQTKDQVRSQKFSGNQFFLIDADDLPEHIFKMRFILNVQDLKSVSHQLLIIAVGGGAVKMNPEKFAGL